MEVMNGAFVIVGANTATPSYFWKGNKLTHVNDVIIHIDEDTHTVKLRVKNITDPVADAMYTEMRLTGIIVKKGGNYA